MKSRLVFLGVAALLAVGLTAPAFGGANALSSSAVSAKSTAEKALAKATKANKRAKAAQASADAAQATADSAVTAAAAAQATADSALTAANSKYDDVTYVEGDESASDQSDKIALADCPGSTEATGGGYALSGAVDAAYVQLNLPYGTGGWYIDADDAAAASNWSVTAYALCIGS